MPIALLILAGPARAQEGPQPPPDGQRPEEEGWEQPEPEWEQPGQRPPDQQQPPPQQPETGPGPRETEPPAEGEEPDEDWTRPPEGRERPRRRDGVWYGNLRLRLSYETVDDIADRIPDNDDTDAFSHLTLGYRSGGDGRFEARFSGRFEKDLDGSAPRGDVLRGGGEFTDTRDVRYPNRGWIPVYEAYLRARDLGEHVTITAGRQQFREVEWGTIDGGRIDATRLGSDRIHLDAAFFGGVRVSHFSSPRVKGIYGGHIIFTVEDIDFLADGATLRVSLSEVYHIDNSFELGVDLGSDTALLHFSNYWINDDAYSLRSAFEVHFEEMGSDVLLQYRRKFGSHDNWEFDYTSSDNRSHGRDRFRTRRLELRDTQPFDDYLASLHQFLIMDKLGIFASIERRELRIKHTEDAWNTSYVEAAAGFEVHNVPIKGMTLDWQFTWHDADRRSIRSDFAFDQLAGEGETDTFEFRTGFRYRLDRVILGVDYFYREFDYRNRFFNQLENLEAHALAAELKVRVTDDWYFRFVYGYDDDLPEISINRDVRYGHAFEFELGVDWGGRPAEPPMPDYGPPGAFTGFGGPAGY